MESWFTRRGRFSWFFGVAVVVLACLRFAHAGLLWSDEDYHLAAAIQILHGKAPYRDFWYDKPPLVAVYYLLIGGHGGWALRLLDAAYVVTACSLAFRLARACWGEVSGREPSGWAAALLLAFYLAFYLPAAVIPFSSDALMLAPHLAAIYCAQKRRAFWSGLWAGVAFLVNTKAVFVLAVCALWLWPEWLALGAGFAAPLALGAIWALSYGAWNGYVEQVWRWGLIYAKDSPAANPLAAGVVRTRDWLGFHVALAVAGWFALVRTGRGERWKLLAWAVLSFAAVCLGGRFAPRYFLQLLPAFVIAGAGGMVIVSRERRRLVLAVVIVALILPLVRFGPHYALLAYDAMAGRKPSWSDIGMDLDSQAAARKIQAMAQPGDTLFVWGYRPDIYVYTRLIAPGLFWDSQPLTGVPADRHLTATNPIYGGPAVANRALLAHSKPTFVVDGLGPINPKLRPEVYPELRPWLANYQVVAKTDLCVVYRRK